MCGLAFASGLFGCWERPDLELSMGVSFDLFTGGCSGDPGIRLCGEFWNAGDPGGAEGTVSSGNGAFCRH